MNLFLQSTNNINPEAIISATIAARSAEIAANQVFYIGLAMLGILLVMGAALMWIVYKVDKLERIAEETAKEK